MIISLNIIHSIMYLNYNAFNCLFSMYKGWNI